MRTSSSIFSLSEENVDNKFIHLTNNAVQKFNNSYCNFEDGNQLSFDDFQEYLNKKFPEKKISVRNDLIFQMKSLIKKSLFSAQKKINAEDRKFCFEIFGYDFIIDTDFNLWLIEINTNPCLELSSQLLKSLIPRMLDDAFKITLDLVFSPNTGNETKEIKQYNVDKYDNNENMWEKICDLNENVFSLAFDSSKINSEYLININEQQILRIKKNIILPKRKMLYAKKTFKISKQCPKPDKQEDKGAEQINKKQLQPSKV